MEEIGEASLHFIKIVGEIDPQISSYRDFSDITPFLKTFYKLFKNESPEGDEENQVKSMVRFLQKNTIHNTNIAIDIDKIIKLDYDQLENLAILMFYCMRTEDNKEECDRLLSKLDETDREALEGSAAEVENASKEDILHKIAREAHEYSTAYLTLGSRNQTIKELQEQYKQREASVDSLVQEEETKIRASHSSSQIQLEQLNNEISVIKSKNSLLAESSQSLTPSSESITPDEEDLEQLQMKQEALAKENDQLRSQIDEYKEKTADIEEYRAKKKVLDAENEPIRQQHKQMLEEIEKLQKEIDQCQEDFNHKNHDLISETNELKEKKEELNTLIETNMNRLQTEKSEGEVSQKIAKLIELRKNRDSLKKTIAQLMEKVGTLRQALLDGQISALKLQLT